MTYAVELRQAEPQLIAAVRDTATSATLSAKITGSPVWDFLRRHGIRSGGHNVVVYRATGRRDFDVEIGADVMEPFEASEGVICSATPAGLAVVVRHIGPYSKLPQAYSAALAWCSQNGYRTAGVSWEIYGHWNDDPSRLETDVFHLVARPEN
jgi:effector-binding domain-containing protein